MAELEPTDEALVEELVRAAYTAARRQGTRIVVTPMVLGESHALFLRLLGRDQAAAALESVLRVPTHVVVTVSEEVVRAAVARWVAPFRDQRFSLCNAVSSEVMQREGITEAISIDRHFRTAGFGTVV